MTDKELLELAAKAAGYKIDEDCYRLDVRDSSGAPTEWNPFTDDGDALRLAVKLGLRVCIDSRSRFTWVKGIEGSTAHGNDATAATRRSIVRAAAEIGKNGAHGIK